MTSLEALKRLKALETPLIETRDVAQMFRISVDLAGKHLESLRKEHFIKKISRGRWLIEGKDFDPLQVAEFLVSPQESYISLHTALFYHGMIEQIPGRIYSVTLDRTRVISSPLGVFSFHHCHQDFFFGFDYIKPYLKLACPEKALVDYFYFSPSRSRQFTKLPEIEFPRGFSWKLVREYTSKIPSQRTRTLVQEKLEGLIQK